MMLGIIASSPRKLLLFGECKTCWGGLTRSSYTAYTRMATVLVLGTGVHNALALLVVGDDVAFAGWERRDAVEHVAKGSDLAFGHLEGK
jgi:hypothetical protein